jgi:hypothetical protein
MIATGLLWYDDDLRRPLAAKIAEAAERYRERVGVEPTTCQLHPSQLAAAQPAPTTGRGSRRKTAEIPVPGLRLIPDEHLRPNYFLVGIESGETVRPVRGWREREEDEGPRAGMTRRRPAVAVTPAPRTPRRESVRPAARSATATPAPHRPAVAAAETPQPAAPPRAKRAPRPLSSPARVPSPAAPAPQSAARAEAPAHRRQAARRPRAASPAASTPATLAPASASKGRRAGSPAATAAAPDAAAVPATRARRPRSVVPAPATPAPAGLVAPSTKVQRRKPAPSPQPAPVVTEAQPTPKRLRAASRRVAGPDQPTQAELWAAAPAGTARTRQRTAVTRPASVDQVRVASAGRKRRSA